MKKTLINSDKTELSKRAERKKKQLAGLKKWKKCDPSPNPKGRPKLEDTFSDTARELMKASKIDITWSVEGKPDKTLKLSSTKTMNYGIVAALIMEALGGNVQAARELVDRTEGKAKETIKQDGTLEIIWPPLSSIDPMQANGDSTDQKPDSE